MKKRKTLVVISAITLGLQILNLLVTIAIILLKQIVFAQYGLSTDGIDANIFPTTTFLGGIIFLILSVLLLVLIAINKNGKLKICGIILVAVRFLISIIWQYLPLVESASRASLGATTFSAYSVLNSTISTFTGPFTLAASVGFYLICGMCIMED